MKGEKKGLKASTVVGYSDYEKKQKLHRGHDLLIYKKAKKGKIDRN
ncbi:hypothetical protein ES705_17473 [subsurface metagenome]